MGLFAALELFGSTGWRVATIEPAASGEGCCRSEEPPVGVIDGESWPVGTEELVATLDGVLGAVAVESEAPIGLGRGSNLLLTRRPFVWWPLL